MGRPLVSVIVPAFNAAATIERAIGSALADAAPGARFEVEVVVVDDASSDGTGSIVEGLAASEPRIRLLRSATSDGPSAARNLALGIASGAWLTFLDADDRLLSGGLAALVDAALAGEALAVVGQRIWTDGRIRWRTADYDIPDVRRSGRASLVSRPGLLNYASGTGKLFHRSLTTGLRFEGRVLGDQPWTIRALLRAGDRIAVIAADVYEWSRPRGRGPARSITASKRASARLAADAVRVAVRAFAEVATEAETTIADPGARDRVVRAYLERLLRQDIAGPVRRAVARRQEGTDELLDAIGTFIESVPTALLGRSDALAREVLRPPLEGWSRLNGSARAAFARTLRLAVARSPELEARLVDGTRLRPGVRLLLRAETDPNDPEVGRLLARQRWLAAVGAARRYLRLAIVRLRTLRPARS